MVILGLGMGDTILEFCGEILSVIEGAMSSLIATFDDSLHNPGFVVVVEFFLELLTKVSDEFITPEGTVLPCHVECPTA